MSFRPALIMTATVPAKAPAVFDGLSLYVADFQSKKVYVEEFTGKQEVLAFSEQCGSRIGKPLVFSRRIMNYIKESRTLCDVLDGNCISLVTQPGMALDNTACDLESQRYPVPLIFGPSPYYTSVLPQRTVLKRYSEIIPVPTNPPSTNLIVLTMANLPPVFGTDYISLRDRWPAFRIYTRCGRYELAGLEVPWSPSPDNTAVFAQAVPTEKGLYFAMTLTKESSTSTVGYPNHLQALLYYKRPGKREPENHIIPVKDFDFTYVLDPETPTVLAPSTTTGKLNALDCSEETCRTVWEYTLGQGSVFTATKQVVITGRTDGTLLVLSSDTGELIKSLPGLSPTISLSSILLGKCVHSFVPLADGSVLYDASSMGKGLLRLSRKGVERLVLESDEERLLFLGYGYLLTYEEDQNSGEYRIRVYQHDLFGISEEGPVEAGSFIGAIDASKLVRLVVQRLNTAVPVLPKSGSVKVSARTQGRVRILRHVEEKIRKE